MICSDSGHPAWVKRADVVPATEAVAFFSAKLKESPTDTFALNSRGWTYHLLGNWASAKVDFDQFLRLTPAVATGEPGVPLRWEGLVNRGLLFADRGDFERALKDLDEAVNLSGKLASVTAPLTGINRGFVHELRGDYESAFKDYSWSGGILMLGSNNMAWAWATYPDRYRNLDGALLVAKDLCRIAEYREGIYLDTAAAVYASAGQFDDAVKTQEKALEDPSFVARYGDDARKRLRLYQDKKPFRMPAPKT
jgi:serine/threonine-protein kinase